VSEDGNTIVYGGIWSADLADANSNLENFHNCLLDRVLLTLLGAPRCSSLWIARRSSQETCVMYPRNCMNSYPTDLLTTVLP
jgi:hypothetical protein